MTDEWTIREEVTNVRELARRLRRRGTDAERLLWRHLRGRQLDGYKFRRQKVIGAYIVDFVCPERTLIVEVDGGQHMERQRRDERRSEYLVSRGYRVLRFWNNEVLAHVDEVLHRIHAELTQAPHPDPLPKGERGKDGSAPSTGEMGKH